MISRDNERVGRQAPILRGEDALHFLLKPVDELRDAAALERYLSRRDAWLRGCDLQSIDATTRHTLMRRQAELVTKLDALHAELRARHEGAMRRRLAMHTATPYPPQRTSRKV